MKGLLKEKSEIEKLKREYQIFLELNFNREETAIQSLIPQQELIPDECNL